MGRGGGSRARRCWRHADAALQDEPAHGCDRGAVSQPVQPPRWDAARLEADRQTAIGDFRRERIEEPLEQYLEFFQAAREAMENLLELSVDLSDIRAQSPEILADPAMRDAARYLASPPISKDDLETLAEVTMAPTLLRKEPDRARRLIAVILEVLDRERFPWVTENRTPTEAERETALVASAAMRAFRRAETERRTQGKRDQENQVKEFLVDQCGFVEVATRPIPNITKAPDPGQFCGESLVGERLADICVRLWDGRLMPLECKVSNSATNSYKRINNDAAVKAVSWRADLGPAHTVPAAVLSGVFSHANLVYAQDRGLSLFWAHDLATMKTFIDATR